MGVRFDRAKPRHWGLSIAYKLNRMLPRQRALDFFLDMEWIAWRLAYENAAWLDLHRRPIDFMLDRIEPTHQVLDFGCGHGDNTAAIAPLAKRAVGVDINPANVAAARQAFPGVEFVCADAFEYLDAGHRFDVLILSHVLEHMDDPDALLADTAHRFDLIYVEVPDFDSSPLNPLRVKRGRAAYTDADHVAEFDRRDMQTMFSRSGLEVIDHEFVHGWMRFWLRRNQAVRP
jgi:SAM-dependent methyltransferase